jgi:acyl-CoA thioester hydrolase
MKLTSNKKINLINTVSSYQLTLEIKPYNIDAAGHVNNAVYINWLEDLRISMFKKILPLDEIIKKGYHLVVAFTTIEYKRPLYLFDRPIGKIKIDRFERGIWYISVVIELKNKIVAKAKQKCVFIDSKTNMMVKHKINL